jgi:glycosyltransferase involved in cell wall biosynthesis
MEKIILFVFDRVPHYQRDLFVSLETRLRNLGMKLILFSGEALAGETGRVRLKEKVIEKEHKYRFKEWKVRNFTFRKHENVLKRIRDIKPDVVIVMSHVGNISYWQLMRLKRKLGFKLVAWQCGYEYNPSRIKDFILMWFIPGFDHHLAYHTNARKYALRYGATEQQTTVIHNTINEEKIQILPKIVARAYVLARHPDIGDRRIVLFVGAILEEKQIPVILKALDILNRNDLVLLVVGDGPYMSELRKLCSNRSDVILAGSIVEEVSPYFDAAEVYVLPGTGGLGINEAMTHSLPVISGYADGSADDLVIDGKNGFRLWHGTAEELADKLASVLDNDEIARRMGGVSRKMITGQFAFRHFIDRVCGTLETI